MSLAYHRLFRALPSYRWWKPLVVLVLAVAAYLVLSTVVVVGVAVVVGAVAGPDELQRLRAALADDPLAAADPLVMTVSLGSIAVMLPSVLLATRLVGRGAPGRLWSVTGRIRWRWLLRCVPAGLAFVVLSVGLSSVVLPALLGEPLSPGPVTTPPATLAVSALVIVLLVPLQATGEEVAFRGLAAQALGAWLPWAAVAIVLPTVAFALAHDYNAWGVLDVAVFGVGAAVVTWRTGGLEAAIVAHVLNNTAVFLLLAPFEGVGSSDGSPLGLAVTLVSVPVFVLLVLRRARRDGVARLLPSPTPVASSPQEAPAP
ncbi:lysostaphin resistance A-like protein [Frigoribacterium salinisoli]